MLGEQNGGKRILTSRTLRKPLVLPKKGDFREGAKRQNTQGKVVPQLAGEKNFEAGAAHREKGRWDPA